MALPLALISGAVSSLMSGPINKIIESYVSDLELRRKLQAELETNMITHLGKSLELQQAIVLAEVKSEHWLTRSWRPILMLTLVFFLVLVGLVIPLADLAAGHAIPFNPRWQSLPDGFWNFLTIGVGGYIGGRSVEKIAGAAVAAPSMANALWKRRK
jgi:Holin of 3TMs, for gene-transfer release